MKSNRLDLAFEGGGARGLALNGAIAELDKEGFLPGRLVGTSAGAICAALVAAGYTGKELVDISRERTPDGRSTMTVLVGNPSGFSDDELRASSLGTFLRAIDVPFVPEAIEDRIDLAILRALLRVPLFPNVFSFVEEGGLFSADGFVGWLSEKLDARLPGSSQLTLGQLYEVTGRHLSVVVTDTTRGTFCVLNHVTAPLCPVVWAVRMSMGIPFFWPEVVWKESWGTYGRGQGATPLAGHTMVDGGVVSNFALRLLVSDEDWIRDLMGGAPDPESHVLGLCLDTDREVADAPSHLDPESAIGAALAHGKVFRRVERVVNAALSGNDLAEAASHPALVCSLPAKGYGVTEFSMSLPRIDALLAAAEGATRTWLSARGPRILKVKEAQQMVSKRAL